MSRKMRRQLSKKPTDKSYPWAGANRDRRECWLFWGINFRIRSRAIQSKRVSKRSLGRTKILWWLTRSCLAFLLAGFPSSPHARVVGIVFDDSGSMRANIHLPTFGVQLLVSTLDGRDGRDRLLTTRLSEFVRAFGRERVVTGEYRPILPIGSGAVTPDNVEELIRTANRDLITHESIYTEALLRSRIESIAKSWPTNFMHTPYEPIEILLHALTNEIREDEEAFLIIFSDGAFYDGIDGMVPTPQQLRVSYSAYKERFKGSLRVFFLLTLNGGDDTRRLVDQQGVRDALIETFPGSKGYEVADFDSLLQAMFEIIGEVSSTDAATSGDIVEFRGREVSLSLPFTVRRIISLSVGEESGQIPQLTETDFSVGLRLDLAPRMLKGDNQNPSRKIPGWPTTKLRGNVAQLYLSPPLQPGAYRLTYDSEVVDRVHLLFSSDVFLEWSLIDQEGNKLVPASDGAYVVQRGIPYTMMLRVLEETEHQVSEVSLLSLPTDAIYTANLIGPGFTKNFELVAEKDSNRAAGPIVFEREGDYGLTAALRLPGFITSRSEDVKVRVEDTYAAFGLALERLAPCAQPCGESDIPFTYTPVVEMSTLADFAVTVDAHRQGRFSATLTDRTPEGLVLLDSAGQPLPEKPTLAFTPGEPVKLSLARIPGWQPFSDAEFGTKQQEIGLVLETMPPLHGRKIHTFALIATLPEAKLKYVGHSQSPGTDQPLTLDLDDFARPSLAMDLLLIGALYAPTMEDFSVAGGPFPLGYDTVVNGYDITIFPKISSALHFFGYECLLISGDHDFNVTYRGVNGLQRASTSVPLRITASWPARVWVCGRFLLWLLVQIWLAGTVLGLVTARRFPRRSRLDIKRETDELTHPFKLRGSIWPIFFRCLFWPVYWTRRHETRRVEGLTLVPGSGGPALVSLDAWPSFKSMLNGGILLEDIAEQRGNPSVLQLLWDDVLDEMVAAGRTITLVRNARRPR